MSFCELFLGRFKLAKNGCWEWTGHRQPEGYGQVGRSYKAHRLAWELFRGPIPPKMEVCHRCDNPPCVNPEHLWLGTHSQNIQDMVAKGYRRSAHRNKSTCPQGHPYDFVWMRNGKPWRKCRRCQVEYQRNYRARRAENARM